MRIEHIAMYVKELEKARDFFVKYFHASPNEGYHNKTTGFRSYFLRFDDGARLEIMNRPGMDDSEKRRRRRDISILPFRWAAGKQSMT